ncbi:hypothetical protein BGW36DRAFT_371108 [Talaromyces proteolyticus]|uniref:DUF7703 domain-containing protein n=1 Tax=Talaromyces proteolyticus TaxID=1131652 RepID=A0AAD4KUP9_9EURO|nr:uncharacterized protein BGW36DRAFT_371108 [Talaromyces proteolyticus]KAH8701562.1 hypothetical protein BGW36DRAFT_371108 [Talaromyces proteolyticus]
MASSNNIPLGLVNGVSSSSLAVKITVGVFLSLALYNATELIILILLTFNKYHGLYFWSILISTLVGVIPLSVGSLLHFFTVGPLAVALVITTIGFYAMVPFQSLVLYSRLHLVFYNERGLRAILYTVITNSIVLIIPTTVTTYGSAFLRSYSWNRAYEIMEKLQLTGFCVQEFLISSLYIYETIKLLRLNPRQGRRRRKIMYELLALNLVVMLLDIALMVMEFLNIYYMQVSFKTLVYSIKLKLEFAVLGKLVSFADHSQHESLDSGIPGHIT